MRARFLSTIPSVLNGELIQSTRKVPVYSPENAILHHFLPLDNAVAAVPKIAADAHAGFLKWSNRPYNEKAEVLFRAAELISSDLESFVNAHCEIGAGRGFAEYLAAGAVANIREYALLVSRPDGLLPKTLSTDLALAVRTPIGPVLSIAPWNAPTILWARAIVAPLAAGCSVVMKASESAPIFPYLYTKHLLAAGVDKEALQLVQVDSADHAAVTEAFLKDSHIRKVNFTGSSAVGAQIAQVAGQHLKPALLELGGKNVSVVCKDADIDRAALDAVRSAWLHKGQVCMCLDKVYVEESIYDEFLAKMLLAAEKLASDPLFQMNQRNCGVADKVRALVTDALDKGATVLFGDATSAGAQFDPIILGDVDENMEIDSEETFGPVLSISKFTDADALITKINMASYGLKVSVWSKNVVQAVRFAKRIEAGGVHINSSSVHDEATVAHGGVKLSGYGRFNSTWGIDEFSFQKTITILE